MSGESPERLPHVPRHPAQHTGGQCEFGIKPLQCVVVTPVVIVHGNETQLRNDAVLVQHESTATRTVRETGGDYDLRRSVDSDCLLAEKHYLHRIRPDVFSGGIKDVVFRHRPYPFDV